MAQDLLPNNQEELPSCIILSMFNRVAVEECRAWRRGRFRKGVTKKGSGADTALSSRAHCQVLTARPTNREVVCKRCSSQQLRNELSIYLIKTSQEKQRNLYGFSFFFRFNYEIKPPPFQAKGQILQVNEAYTCSNTFQGAMKGTSGLVGLLVALFLAGMSGLGLASVICYHPCDWLIDQGLCVHHTTFNQVSIIDFTRTACGADDCAEKWCFFCCCCCF